MAVVSAFVPNAGIARLNTNVLALATDAEVVDRDEDGIYVDLSGIQERAFRTLLGTGAKPLDTTFFRQGKKVKDDEPDGVHGEGIPNVLAERGERMNVRGIMGKPKF